MKKRVSLFVLGLALVILFATIASAYGYMDFESASNDIIRWISEIFGPFFAVLFGSSEFLFEKILFFFIVVAITFVGVSRVPALDNKIAIIWIITFSVAVLSTRFLTESQVVQSILLPYSVLGIALTGGIPLVIYFYFVQAFDSGTLRKILWIFFIVIFIGIWFSRYDDLGSLSYIYFFTGVVALIFLLADGTIRRALINQQMKQLNIDSRSDFERKILRQLRDVDEDLNDKIITPSQHRYLKNRLGKQLKAIRKN